MTTELDDAPLFARRQVDRCDPEVRVSKLTLNDDERGTLVRHLDRVSVPEPSR